MSTAVAVRQVEREVRVYTCDSCRTEALEEQLPGWVVAGIYSLVDETDPLSRTLGAPPRMRPVVKNGEERHLCGGCAKAFEAFFNQRVAA